MTASVHLELFGESHLPMVESMLDDEAVLRFTLIPVPVPEGFAANWYARYRRGREAGTSEAFAIIDGNGEPVGLALAVSINRATRTAELGYMVAPAARGRGVAQAALRQLSEWAFAELDMLRLELMISARNEASRRVAERCGYVREGVLRSRHVKGDLREDTEIWARLPTDPDP
ncbi:MAG: GNAT family N-acetyltransferase [Gaiellales bacterium]